MPAEGIQVVVRGIVMHKGKILFAMLRNGDYYFLPGGHVKFGETLSEALRGEFIEELGVEARGAQLLGLFENQFMDGKRRMHEINFVYRVRLNKYNLASKEKHIDFKWLSLADIRKAKLLPTTLKKRLFDWI